MVIDLDYNEWRQKALHQYDSAFHLLNVTYASVKDPKMLIGVISNLTLGMEYTMEAILAYERQLKLIPVYGDSFQGKLNMFRLKSLPRNKIPMSYVLLLIDLKQVLELHKKAPVEFQRGNSLIICNNEFRVKGLSAPDIQGYLLQAKEFMDMMSQIVTKYDQTGAREFWLFF